MKQAYKKIFWHFSTNLEKHILCFFKVKTWNETDLSSLSLKGIVQSLKASLFPALQHVPPLIPAGPAEGDTFPDPHNALGHQGHHIGGWGLDLGTP